MRKPYLVILILCFLLISILIPRETRASQPEVVPLKSPASELIDAVNALRVQKGLAAVQPNSILNNIAQSQADYELSISVQTDVSANGLRPYQRALAAGYPVAGNVTSDVGYLSELLFGGVKVSAQECVDWWYSDPGHKPYLMSLVYQDVGAGVAVVNNTYYYVLVLALSTGGTPVPFIPPATYKTPVVTKVPNTPNADGSIIYVVQPGDTPLGIAIAYAISLDELYSLNDITDKSVIFPDQQIIIRNANTPTPTQPTGSPTGRPTITAWSTSTLTRTATSVPPTLTPMPGKPFSEARGAVIAIVVTALAIAALIALLGRKRKTK
jgi:uncharacterized protein YkwD